MADVFDQFNEMAQGLNAGSIFTMFNTGVMGKIYFFLKVAFWMVLVLFSIILIYKFVLQYKVKLTVYKRIGTGSVEVLGDRAKIVKDSQNKIKLQLFRLRKGSKLACTLPIPEAMYKGKSGKSDHYNLWMDDNYELHPIVPPRPETEFEKLEIRPQERAAWGRMEDEILFKKYQKKDKLLAYATPAILMVACVSAFLIFFFASKELGAGMTELAVTFKQIASSCTKMSP